jgi:2,4-dienoyl-CoA reductase-like NADH-dependent reductase (Old Yellow Enzyme family)
VSKPLLFQPLTIRGVTLKNRVCVAPMHQYAADHGFATDWHLMNIGRFAAGGASLTFVESTKVDPRGCGTVGDLALWDDKFIPGVKRLADFIKAHNSVAAIQIGHSARKAKRFRPWEGGKPLLENPGVDEDYWNAWELVAPSAVPASESDPTPRALTNQEVKDLVNMWGEAARRANDCGFDILEIHGAHGYCIHQFLSPQANVRNDEYGGSEENRMRFCLEVIEAVRANWPDDKPLFLRLSVEDRAGWGIPESIRLSQKVKPLGVDVIDCSGGGMQGSPTEFSPSYGYQVPYADAIRREADILTMAVGLIVHAEQAEAILQNGQADIIALAREILYNPNWPMDAARKLGVEENLTLVPDQQAYWLGRRDATAPEVVPSTFGRDIQV